jgi:hypothetical protein
MGYVFDLKYLSMSDVGLGLCLCCAEIQFELVIVGYTLFKFGSNVHQSQYGSAMNRRQNIVSDVNVASNSGQCLVE